MIDVDMNKTDVVIRKEAHRWAGFIQQNTIQYKPYWEYEDLVQEGWIAALKAYKDFDETRGATFIVFLWQAVRFRFQNIYHKKIKRDLKRTFCHLPSIVEEKSIQIIQEVDPDPIEWSMDHSFAERVTPRQEYSPEDYAILADLLNEVGKSSKGLVDMIIDGVPEKLFTMLRRKMRHNKFIKGEKVLDGSISPDKTVIENFFQINLSEIRPKGL